MIYLPITHAAILFGILQLDFMHIISAVQSGVFIRAREQSDH